MYCAPSRPQASPGEKELTDAEMDKQMAIKQKAVDDLEDGNLAGALDKYTQVLKMGNPTALLYVRARRRRRYNCGRER